MKNELSRFNDGFFNYDFFDEAMRDLFPTFHGRHRAQGYMRTDVRDTGDGYSMEIEMPGLDKKDINIDMKDGYITVSAKKTEKD